MKEIYKHFRNGYYEVSNLGNVRRAKAGVNTSVGRVKKTSKSNNGYLIFGHFENGVRKNILVHRAVAELFISKIPKGYVINHKDGNKLNNHVNNLEIVTVSENSLHAIKNGLSKAPTERAREDGHWTRLYPNKVARGRDNGAVKHPERIKRGSQVKASKLNERKVSEIRKLSRSGKNENELAELYGVSRRNINNIIKNRTWRHVE